MAERQIFYADGMTVFKKSTEQKLPEGGVRITIGFPVCKVTDVVSQDGVVSIVALLNEGAASDELRERIRHLEQHRDDLQAKNSALHFANQDLRQQIRAQDAIEPEKVCG